MSEKAPTRNDEVRDDAGDVKVRDHGDSETPKEERRKDGEVRGTPSAGPRIPKLPPITSTNDYPSLAEFAISLCANRIAHQKPTGIMCDACRPMYDHQMFLVTETKARCLAAIETVKNFLADDHDKKLCDAIATTVKSVEPFVGHKPKEQV